MKRWLLGNSFALLAFASTAQWQVPTSIVVDGVENADRHVNGLGTPEGGDHAASVHVDRSSTTNYSTALGINTLNVTLSPAPGTYTPGMRITFTPSSVNTGDASLNANGLGDVPLRKNINAPLDSGDLRPGVPMQVLYDGAVFQVTSQVYPGCPAGYKPVGVSSCIEEVSHDPVNWYTAVLACSDQGKRLCGFTEWMQACLQSDNIFGSIVDYEWIDEASNNANDGKTMGINATTLLPDCRSGGTREPLQLIRYRCCYDR